MRKIWAGFVFSATLLAASAVAALTPDEARHLLNRTGFGATQAEIAELAPLDRAAAVDRLLSRTRTAPLVPPPAFLARDWPPYRDMPAMTQEDRDKFLNARREELQQLKGWWYAEMIATPSPLTERMTLFWHNHFVSAFEAVGNNVHRMWDQNALFRREATGSFGTLLAEILVDPVMLRYLDASTNRKGRPNENLARELLELFTLGEGHYSETDIKEIARALTGLTIDRNTDWGFRYVAGMHDDGAKRFLGTVGLSATDVMRTLLLNRRTAQFVAEKMWREFVAPTLPPAAEIERVASALRGNDYAIKPALRALFLSAAFWDPANRGAVVKSPVALIVGAHRDLGLPVVDLAALPVYGRRLGQDLFEPPNVKGWPGGDLWITPASLVARYDVLGRLLANRDLVPARPQPGAREVALRVAGDGWQGGPRMVVRADGGRTLGTREIEFATDTARFGMLPDRADWTWRVVRFPVEGAVRSVSVEFVNDGGAPAGPNGVRRGDRNLFIEWLEIDGETFPARDGEQVVQNQACRNNRPGDLYCGGTLTFDLEKLRAAGKARAIDGLEGMMAAPPAGGMMMMAPTPVSNAPRGPALPPRDVHLDADSWRAALPPAWRAQDALWRALSPVPPVADSKREDSEATLRAIVLDPAYQLM